MSCSEFVEKQTNGSSEITNLKKIRQAQGLSQSELASLAEVELRPIQMCEQRRNDINKAQVETLYKTSKCLRL